MAGSPTLSVKWANRLQRLARQLELPIPLLLGRDVIRDLCMAFPILLGQAAAFDPNRNLAVATVAARGATAAGIRWTLAPVLDSARAPQRGAHHRGSSKDPALDARLATRVRRFQGTDMSCPDRQVAWDKHFAGYDADAIVLRMGEHPTRSGENESWRIFRLLNPVQARSAI